MAILARYTVVSATLVPYAWLCAYLVRHRHATLADLLSGSQLLVLLAATILGLLATRCCRVVLEAVDRRFPREQYDASQLLKLPDTQETLSRNKHYGDRFEGVRLSVRRALQYALARYTTLALALVPWAALCTYLVRHRDDTLTQLFTSSRLVVLLAANTLSLLAMRYRRPVLDFIDLHFFREVYDARRQLGSNAHAHESPKLATPFSRRARLVRRPPGSNLRHLAEFLFSRKTYERVIVPTLCDLDDEYCEALAAGRAAKARFVLIRGYCSYWAAFFSQVPVSLLKSFAELWKLAGPGP